MVLLRGFPIQRSTAAGPRRGRALPAFIKNGDYYDTCIDVYEDGVVDCWGAVDLALFDGKLASGWVRTAPEVDARVSIHGLGSFKVAEAAWRFTTKDLRKHVHAVVDELRTDRVPLIDMHGSDVEVRDGVRTAKLGLIRDAPVRGDGALGHALPILARSDEKLAFTRLFVFADESCHVGFAGPAISLTDVANGFASGALACAAPSGAWLAMEDLGSCRIGDAWFSVDPHERLREALDEMAKLRGEPGAIARCMDAWERFEADASDANRAALRRAYEAVPMHLRMYCGDMDRKDWPIRRALGLVDAGDDDDELL